MPPTPIQNPDVRPRHWWEEPDVHTFIATCTTSGASWIGGLVDWRGFLIITLPLFGKAVIACLKPGYKPVTAAPPPSDDDAGV